MEPQLPKPQLPNVEQVPSLPTEQLPDNLEKGVLQESREKNLVNPELDQQQTRTQQTQQLQPDDQVATVPQQVSVAQPHNPVATSNTPIVAADEDVIEKEWVDKAKEIVSKNKDDPRMQKHEVSSLQADYIKKRYGKTIKVPDES